ncbi:MAG TPA: hypothetical protein VF712_13765 [Thermoleophilaceae bacterium]|jgi:hypothetical protein
MPRLRHILLLCAALFALSAPAPALADGDEVIRDCYDDGKLDKEYSREELEDADSDLPSDVDEYSDCRSVIRSAMERGGKGKRGGTGGVPGAGFRGGGTANSDPALSTGSGAQAASHEDLDALNQLTGRSGGSEPKVPVAGQPITPAAGAASVGESANDMPTPLLAALIAVGALGALGGAFAAWRRRPQLLRRGPLRFGRG